VKPSAQTSDDDLVFRDPKEYEHLSKQEKDELTERMMKKFKAWAKDPMPKSPDGSMGKRQRKAIDG